jgi:hypothetical protein
MNHRTLVLSMALFSAFASADVLEPGFHGVTRKVCYQFGDSAGYQPVAVVDQLTSDVRYRYVPLENDSCVDQGYKFNSVQLYWVPVSSLEEPIGETNPLDLSKLTPIVSMTNDGRIASNYTQVPDSIPEVSERWVYTIVGGYTAETTVEKCFSATATTATSCTLLNIDYFWPNSIVLPVRTRTASNALALVQVRGSKVRVRIPGQAATLRVFTLSGRLMRQMRIASTNGALGEVDLGMTPGRGTFVELRQGDVRSVIAVGSR